MSNRDKAFPIVDGKQVYETGMDLRDYFAAKAMAALMIEVARTNNGTDIKILENHVAKMAYGQADAMLKYR